MVATTPNRHLRTTWRQTESLTENTHIPDATRVIDPRGITVHERKRLGGDQVALVGGWEGEHAAAFEYQLATKSTSRIPLPPEAMMIRARTNRGAERSYPGIGAGAGQLAIVGGSASVFGSADVYAQLNDEVFIVDGDTHQARAIDGLEEPRAASAVTFSPDGRYLLVAGGFGARPETRYHNNRRPYEVHHQKPLDSVEVYDLDNGCWVDVAETFPGLEKMPAPRIGGSVCWVQDDHGDRIVFAGGTAEVRGNTFATSFPEGEIFTYASSRKCNGTWTKTPGTPRLFPGMAAHKLADGCTQVIIGGGGTGFEPREGRPRVDPQLYSVDLLNPHTGDLTAGYNLPRQPAVATSSVRDRTPATFVEWGGTAVAVYQTACDAGTAEQGQAGANAVKHALTFGFSKGYAGIL